VVFRIRDADQLIAFYDNGHGPLSTLPLWLRAVLFLGLADFMMYWLHRLFHGGGVRKYHAIHHSWTCRSGPSGCRKAGCPIITGWTINRRFRPRSPANWLIRCGNRPGTRTVLRHPLSRTVRSWPRATMSGTGLTSGSVAGPIQRFVSATSMRSLNLALTYL
jgi:Fatty acid hydroxylase superfamily